MARRHEAHGQQAASQTPPVSRVCQRSAGIAQLASRNEVHAQCSAIASIFFLTNQRKLVSDELVGRTDRQPCDGFACPGVVTATTQGHYVLATITARHMGGRPRRLLQRGRASHPSAIMYVSGTFLDFMVRGHVEVPKAWRPSTPELYEGMGLCILPKLLKGRAPHRRHQVVQTGGKG